MNLGNLLSVQSFEHSLFIRQVHLHPNLTWWALNECEQQWYAGRSITIDQLLSSLTNINPMEKRGWNSSRTARDAVILKENSVCSNGCYHRWIRREIRTVKGKKDIKNGREVNIQLPIQQFYAFLGDWHLVIIQMGSYGVYLLPGFFGIFFRQWATSYFSEKLKLKHS